MAPFAWLTLGALLGVSPATFPVAGMAMRSDLHAPRGISVQTTGGGDSIVVTDTLTQAGHGIQLVASSVRAADAHALRRALNTVARALTLYGRLTGIPYPWSHYTMQFLPVGSFSGGGATQGHGLVYYDYPLPDAQTEHDRPGLTTKVLAHELAHQWDRGHGTMADDPHRNVSEWLVEGFADFMAGQVWRAAGGARAEEEYMLFYNARWSQAYAEDPAKQVLRTTESSQPDGWFSLPWMGAQLWDSSIVQDQYYGGALVLWMLQQYLGETRFWAAMHTYLTMPPHGADDSHDFQQAIQTATGENLDWFFQEWVYGHGYPRFTVAATYEATAQRVTLQVHQTAPVFRMPVAIRVGTARGDVLAHATVDGATQRIVIEHVAQPPTFVVFDDGDAIVKTLAFPQPTAWLVAQLQRDARPWQTAWVIEQLRQRAGQDTAAVTALGRAAQHGRYALTRAQALIALGSVTTSAAPAVVTQAVTPAVLRGVEDTAVLVRRAALYGATQLGTPTAHTVIRNAFAHDSSLLVRADAITSLLLAPTTSPAERQTLFARALQEPSSYLDMVPTAAVKAMAMTTCDSTTLTTLQTAMHQPGVTAMLQRVTNELTESIGSSIDPTCLQTFAGLLPLPVASH